MPGLIAGEKKFTMKKKSFSDLANQDKSIVSNEALDDDDNSSIFAGLSDDVSKYCLALVPRSNFLAMGCVSKRWKRFIQSKEFITVRKLSGQLEEWLYILTSDSEGKGSHWEVMDSFGHNRRSLPPMPGTRKAEFGVVVLNGKLLVMAGHSSIDGPVSVSPEVYQYNSNLDSWMRLSNMNVARYDFASAEVNGLVYAVGGYGAEGHSLSSAEVYDPDTNKWTLIESLRRPRWGCFACGFEGKLYVMGGRSSFTIGNSKSVDVYDPKKQSWCEMKKGCVMVTAHAVLEKKLFCMEWKNQRKLSIFNPDDHSWKTVSVPLTGSSSVGFRFGILNGKLLLFSLKEDPTYRTLLYDPNASPGSDRESERELPSYRTRNGEMEVDDGTNGSNSNVSTITISVKFSGSTIPISISPQSTIKELKSLLLPATNVLPRGQKLIFKGKVLEDPVTLAASNLSNGSKLMLVASQGLYQGDGPVLKKTQVVPKSRKDNQSSSSSDAKKVLVKNRSERWKVTGVVALSECNLEAIPDEVWVCGSSARVLDCNNNLLRNVPVEISQLTRLEKLLINANDLSDESINWEGLMNLKYLTVLSLNQNRLTTLPSALGSITSLRELHVSNNELAGLPDEIGQLTQLEVLKANNNRMSKISEFIGNCHSLVEVDFSSNFLSQLPETFSSFNNLKALHLSNNGMKSLPSKLFKTCLQLSTLDLHNTEITIDLLRQFEGWDNFDERRRSKHQKQIEFRVGVSRDFDEGADKN